MPLKLFEVLFSLSFKFFRFLRGREPILIFGVLLMVIAAWGFLFLADEVQEGSTAEFDRWMVESLRSPGDINRPIGPEYMGEIGRDLSALGGIAILSLFIAGAAGFLIVTKAFRTAVWLIGSTTTGMGFSLLLKTFYNRPRPNIVPHLTYVFSSSFPSGHSMMSAVVYLTLGAIVSSVLTGFALRFYVMTLAIVLTTLVGLSRIYVGVHYPSDVLAGWTVGSIWAVLCWLVGRRWIQSDQQVSVVSDASGDVQL